MGGRLRVRREERRDAGTDCEHRGEQRSSPSGEAAALTSGASMSGIAQNPAMVRVSTAAPSATPVKAFRLLTDST